MTVRPRKISVVTGSRAEFGLLSKLVNLLHKDPETELQLLVTGTHLEDRYGYTKSEITKLDIPIAAEVPLALAGTDPVDTARAMGRALEGFGVTFNRLRPDIVVVLGDRFEIFAAAQAAMLADIPIAHIHGGEVTEGAFDDSIRHALTKMASLHFVAAEPYRDRVIQMGEAPERVFNVGAPGIDQIRDIDRPDRAALMSRLNLSEDSLTQAPLFAVTYHPVTRGVDGSNEDLGVLFDALDAFPEARLVFTGANADPGGAAVNASVERYVAERSDRARYFVSLGYAFYGSLVEQADCVVGNSSSGILEAPSLGTPTVNIGRRQKGRLRAPSVIDCAPVSGAVQEAIRKALTPEFKAKSAEKVSPFGNGKASRQMIEVLRNMELEGLTLKPFFDLK